MGIASYREDLLESFFEGKPVPLPPPRPPLHQCPYCRQEFVNRKDLSEHLFVNHQGERPILLIRGREPENDSAIRQSIFANEIVAENCTSVRIKKFGIALPDNSQEGLSALLCSERNTVLEIELSNEFDPSANPIEQCYRVTLCIPEKSALDAVDRDFVTFLASKSAHMSDVDHFLRQKTTQGTVREYADALASYVRGVLVKDGSGGSTLPQGEVNTLYGKALDTLRGFQRPLPRVICGLVRLAFNDFSLAAEKTGFDRLDRCFKVFTLAVGSHSPDSSKGKIDIEDSAAGTVALCPVDQALDMIFEFSEHYRLGRMSLGDCRYVIDRMNLTHRDRAKIFVLHTLAALELNAISEAQDSLRQLLNEFPFQTWASQELEKLEG